MELHLVGFIIEKCVTILGHMNIKYTCVLFIIFSMVRAPFLFGDQPNNGLQSDSFSTEYIN
jgi:hypothetical protein